MSILLIAIAAIAIAAAAAAAVPPGTAVPPLRTEPPYREAEAKRLGDMERDLRARQRRGGNPSVLDEREAVLSSDKSKIVTELLRLGLTPKQAMQQYEAVVDHFRSGGRSRDFIPPTYRDMRADKLY